MSDYYDPQGNAITMTEWANGRRNHDWFDASKRSTKVEDSEVSTVWLGLDHSWGNDGPPLIFESMVFGGGLDQEQVRYSTLDEAHAGHEKLVERVRVEADAFRALAADPAVVAAVRLVQERLTAHLEAFGTYDYDGRAYARLAAAVTA